MATIEELTAPIAAVLVTAARQRRRVTYGEVAQTVGTHARVVPKVLIVLRDLCIENGWPALTSIVVRSTTGKPGDGLLDPWVARDTVAAAKNAMTKTMQDEVYDFDWTPLLNRFGPAPIPTTSSYLPIKVTLQATYKDGVILIDFPGTGARTRIDQVHGSPWSHGELFGSLKSLLMQARQWPR